MSEIAEDPTEGRIDFEGTDITEENRSRFRHRLFQIHRPIREMGASHPLLGDPTLLVHSYDDITFLQFPIREEERIIVTFDGRALPPDEVVSGCEEIVYRESGN